jgi:hypothetical protein
MKLLLALMIAVSLLACGKKADDKPVENLAQPLVDDKKAAEDAVKAVEEGQRKRASAADAADTK